MSLHISVDSLSQTVKAGAVIRGAIDRTYMGDDLRHQEVNNDLMLDLLGSAHHWVVPYGGRSIRSIYSFILPEGGKDDLSVSFPVSYAERGPGSAYDDKYHSSISRGILILGSVLSGRGFDSPSYQNEHPCEHGTYSGELLARQGEIPFDKTSIDLYGNSIESSWSSGVYLGWCTVSSVTPLMVSFQESYYSTADYDLVYTIKHMLGNTYHSIVWWNGGEFYRTLSDITAVQTSTYYKISYHMVVDSSFPFYQHYDWDASFYIPFMIADPCTHPVVGYSYNVQYGDFCAVRYITHSATPFTGLMDRTIYGTPDNFQVYPRCLSVPYSTAEAEHDISIKARTFLFSKGPLDSFRRAVENDWYNFVPSAMFSTVDAFKAAQGNLGVNVLQDLQKIPGIYDSLPQIEEGIRIAGKILRKDISLLTIKEILDLLTSTTLQASFEWRPYMGLLSDYLPRMASTYKLLSDMRSIVIGYGSFSYKIHSDLGREEVTLLTRTKLVMDGSPRGLLSTLIGLDAYGILPKPSALWDLIPFSFVASWFTGVGPAMKRAEYSLALMGIPAYFVHTFTISSPLSSLELESMKTSNSSDELASIRLFYRDVTLFSPVPRDSRFGFGIPKELPPLGVLGSLLYQVIFS